MNDLLSLILTWLLGATVAFWFGWTVIGLFTKPRPEPRSGPQFQSEPEPAKPEPVKVVELTVDQSLVVARLLDAHCAAPDKHDYETYIRLWLEVERLTGYSTDDWHIQIDGQNTIRYRLIVVSPRKDKRA